MLNEYLQLLHIYINGYINKLPLSYQKSFSSPKLIDRIWEVFSFIGQQIIVLFQQSKSSKLIPRGSTWFFVNSKNSLHSIKPLQKLIENSYFLLPNYASHIELISDNKIILPVKSQLKYIPKVFGVLISIFFIRPRVAIRYFDIIIKSAGLIEIYSKLLQHSRPKAIIFTNDHILFARSLKIAAHKAGIKTIYVQHASVTRFFPPLDFTLSLLYGEVSYNIYRKIGAVKGRVETIGMPSFDSSVLNINKNSKIRTIGICTNLLDDFEKVEYVIKEICRAFPELDIILRSHPRETRMFFSDSSFSVSDARKESIFSYLKSIDLLIAGETSTHLEAVMLNICSIYFNFTQDGKRNDYYGYLESKLVPEADCLSELLSLIQTYMLAKPDVRLNAQPYNSTIGTIFEGRSTELAADYITELLAQ